MSRKKSKQKQSNQQSEQQQKQDYQKKANSQIYDNTHNSRSLSTSLLYKPKERIIKDKIKQFKPRTSMFDQFKTYQLPCYSCSEIQTNCQFCSGQHKRIASRSMLIFLDYILDFKLGLKQPYQKQLKNLKKMCQYNQNSTEQSIQISKKQDQKKQHNKHILSSKQKEDPKKQQSLVQDSQRNFLDRYQQQMWKKTQKSAQGYLKRYFSETNNRL